jgi:hypothetical protein
MHRGLLVALLSLALSGCYTSTSQLLDPAQARQPFAAGDFTSHGTAKHLAARSDGQYDLEEKTESGPLTHVVLLNDLGASRGHTIYAFGTWDDAPDGAPPGAYVYGIVVDMGGEGWISIPPDCAQTQALSVATSINGACVFAERSKLLDALRAYAETDEFWTAVEQERTSK